MVPVVSVLSVLSVLSVSDFDRCIADIRASPSARRITARTWEQAKPFLTPDPRVIEQLDAQPEFRLPTWDYLAVMADDERIADGQRLLNEESAQFTRIERRYGVDKYIIAAVWGIESNFGRGQGGYSVLRSLATLSCESPRQTYFRRELLAALRIVQSGHIAPDSFRGSWAGAFGQTQFMPGSFEWLAVDGDGDGRRDVIGSRADALASAANYLRNAGWRSGRTWGIEVRLPALSRSLIGQGGGWRRARRTLGAWGVLGLTRADGAALTGETLAGLFAPAGADGPVFLVTRNFEAIYRYNAAEAYTLAVAHLSDRLRGLPPLVTPWPTDDLGLSRAERRELQQLLIDRGHEIPWIDGLLLAPTREAVKAEQQRLGHEVTGRPGQKLLGALRRAPSSKGLSVLPARLHDKPPTVTPATERGVIHLLRQGLRPDEAPRRRGTGKVRIRVGPGA
jgi:lytic murein transglycosylase